MHDLYHQQNVAGTDKQRRQLRALEVGVGTAGQELSCSPDSRFAGHPRVPDPSRRSLEPSASFPALGFRVQGLGHRGLGFRRVWKPLRDLRVTLTWLEP